MKLAEFNVTFLEISYTSTLGGHRTGLSISQGYYGGGSPLILSALFSGLMHNEYKQQLAIELLKYQ